MKLQMHVTFSFAFLFIFKDSLSIPAKNKQARRLHVRETERASNIKASPHSRYLLKKGKPTGRLHTHETEKASNVKASPHSHYSLKKDKPFCTMICINQIECRF